MEGNQISARKSLETFIGRVVKGLETIPNVRLTELPNALDGRCVNNFEAPADNSIRRGDTFDAGKGLTAEVVHVRHNAAGNASYTVKFYYLN